MSANVDAMVREGINAFKAGRKEEAKALLLKATELDQFNEDAWLWLSGLMDSNDDQRTCLENVLAINPNNERAKQGLSFLTGQSSAGSSTKFTAGAPPTAPSPTAPTTTSVEWGAPDDPPARRVTPPIQEPSADALDDWVNNLNLPVNEAKPESQGAFPFSGGLSGGKASPFGSFDVDDDMFADGPFSASPLDIGDDAPAPPARRSTPSSERERRNTAPAAPRRQPTPRAEATRRSSAPREGGSLLYEFDRDEDEEFQSQSEGELFGYIPPEIAVTRLPGTRERAPILLTLGVIVLILLNLGAATLVMMNLLS